MDKFISENTKSNCTNAMPTPLENLNNWFDQLAKSQATLRQLAGTTEKEFLVIGGNMQSIYGKATDFASTASALVGMVSGDTLLGVKSELHQMLADMTTYRDQTQLQRTNSSLAFSQVADQLHLISEPLDGFKKMSKNLYILEVLIKIESAYMGDIGSEFVTLAMDIKKLAHEIKEKANTINNHRQLLTATLTSKVPALHLAISQQETQISSILTKTGASINELEDVTLGFSQLGAKISTLAKENAERISDIVQSMQFHDIYRQQVEHVLESLEALSQQLTSCRKAQSALTEEQIREMTIHAGDICELQEAQLHFASLELHTAVSAIIENLQNISQLQTALSEDIRSQSGSIDTSNTSFVDAVRHDMSSTANLLSSCALSNADMGKIIAEIGETVNTITDFVSDIEEIGHEVIQVALNARIKAARTGTDGDSLSSLAEEIGQLSQNAVDRTDSITTTLTDIKATTDSLNTQTSTSGSSLAEEMSILTEKLSAVLSTLQMMGTQITSLLIQTAQQAETVNKEIDRLVSSIHVHDTCSALANTVLDKLRLIFVEARSLYPSTDSFRDSLRQMAQKYTMESERKIHEQFTRRSVPTAKMPVKSAKPLQSNQSEFGDNVDLF